MPTEEDLELLPFDEWLQDHRSGAATYEWANALAQLIERVVEVDKPGTLTITIDVEPKGSQLVLVDSIKLKLPEHDREAAIYWPDRVGGLHRSDPAQGRWEDDGEGNMRLVLPATGEVIRTKRGKAK